MVSFQRWDDRSAAARWLSDVRRGAGHGQNASRCAGSTTRGAGIRRNIPSGAHQWIRLPATTNSWGEVPPYSLCQGITSSVSGYTCSSCDSNASLAMDVCQPGPSPSLLPCAKSSSRVWLKHPPTKLSWSAARFFDCTRGCNTLGSDTKAILMAPTGSVWANSSAETPAPVMPPGQITPQRATKLPKPPKPRKVEKRRKSRKG